MSNSDKLLIAGPWVGEFGWELFAWQAYVRALSRHFPRTLIVCRKTSEALYEDFATDIKGPRQRFFKPKFNHIYATSNWLATPYPLY